MSQEKDFSLKIIFLGPSGVGKTSIIASYMDNTFESQSLPTVAPAQCNSHIVIDNKKIELNIWDTAGQERYQSISRMFYRDSQIGVVCFDYNDPKPVKDWIGILRSEVPDCYIILAITKADLLTNEQNIEASQIAHDLTNETDSKMYFLTSSKTGLGIKDLFESCASLYKEIYKQNTPGVENIQPKPNNSKKGCCNT